MQRAKLFAYINNIDYRYKAYSAGQTVPSTAQIRAEGNNTKAALSSSHHSISIAISSL
jgi:hypothetical protein